MSLLQRVFVAGNIQCKRSLITSLSRLSKRQNESSSSSSDSDSSSDDEKKVKKPSVPPKGGTETSREDAKKKLNALLDAMMKEEPKEFEKSKLNLAKPREKQREKHLEDKEKKIDHKKFGEKLVGAATDVAKDLGGDVKQTETELLSRLLYKKKVGEPAEQGSTSASDNDLKKDIRKTIGNLSLNELLTGMKIDRSQPKESVSPLESRADQVRNILGKAPTRLSSAQRRVPARPPSEFKQPVVGERVDIFGAEPLGIFKRKDSEKEKVDEIKLETWESCYKRELKLATTQPPTNIYEQMILWTEKGMLWHFPIDNEQGLEEEKKVPFYEHIHLERHLEGWCPEVGPIRHFMELVCVGLSKNPWLTVDEKQEHIWWFRDYFSEKAKLIKEIGAGEIKIEGTKSVEL